MRIELHVLQNVAPANLNRDDTNSPKDAIFGGYRRARLSSQSQKRSVRLAFADLLPEEDRAVRTRKLLEKLTEHLTRAGKTSEDASEVAQVSLEGLGLGFKDKESEYLLFLGNREVERLAELILSNWDRLVPLAEAGKESRGKKKVSLPDDVKKAFAAVFDGGKAVDLALFGRMLADRPEWNVDAAAQVAHAISTHKVDREFDFYTAVDDLNPKEETGAGMMGDVEFYSATLYRYAQLDLDKLNENLQGDADLAVRGTEAFLRSFPTTLPSGKQNTFAAHNLPDFIAVAVTEGAPRNLANAFLKPVYVRKQRPDEDLMAESISRLSEYWRKLDRSYGQAGEIFFINLKEVRSELHGKKVERFDELVAEVMQRIREKFGV